MKKVVFVIVILFLTISGCVDLDLKYIQVKNPENSLSLRYDGSFLLHQDNKLWSGTYEIDENTLIMWYKGVSQGIVSQYYRTFIIDPEGEKWVKQP